MSARLKRLGSLRHGVPLIAIVTRQECAIDVAGRASLSAPESLTRVHEDITSQVRVSGTERGTSTCALLALPHTAAFCPTDLGF